MAWDMSPNRAARSLDSGPYDTGLFDPRYDPGPKFDVYSFLHISTTDSLVKTQDISSYVSKFS